MSHRINHQPVFLLNSKPWRENSLWLDVFSRDYGRLALLARSARTRGSELRGILTPFVPICASWYGKEELKTLHRAEWIGGWALPKPNFLFSALYVNELVLKLTAKEDPNPQVYQALYTAHQNFGMGNNPIIALRSFEWQLLAALGLAPDAHLDSDGQKIEAHQHYLVQPEHAPIKLPENSHISPTPTQQSVSGALLQELAQNQLSIHSDLNQALHLTRKLMDFYLPQGIKSRQVLQQLRSLKQNLVT